MAIQISMTEYSESVVECGFGVTDGDRQIKWVSSKVQDLIQLQKRRDAV